MNTLFKGLNPQKLGTHRFSFVAALRCKEAGISEEQAEVLIEAEEHLMPRYFKHGEVSEAVSGAFGSNPTAHKKWPKVNRSKRRPIIAQRIGLLDLQSYNTLAFAPGPRQTEGIIDLLFPGNPLLCVGQSAQIFSTKEREKWRGRLADRQFIVPSPMNKTKGITKAGHESPKSDDNTGQRRFLVIEQDTIDGAVIPKEDQEAVLVHLAEKLPLVLAVSSGGKSIHGWYHCKERSEEDLREFMEYAVSLGADPATWNKSQFVRMPDGTRANGVRQEVLYFNPSVL